MRQSETSSRRRAAGPQTLELESFLGETLLRSLPLELIS